MAKKVNEPKEAMSFSELNNILSKFNPNDGGILEDLDISNIDEYISAGPYILNAAISGSLFGGLPSRRSIAFAGAEGSGKTFLAMGLAKNAQDMGYFIIYYDSEAAIDREFAKRLGVDTTKLRIENVISIEDVAESLAKLNNTLEEQTKQGNALPKIMVVIDSLGNLSSKKELEDTLSGSDKRDMTKAQSIKKLFRVNGVKLAKHGIPLVVCNHTYATMDMFKPTEMAGGSGLKYNVSCIFELSKSKLAADKESIAKAKEKNLDEKTKMGVVITVKPLKNRFAKPINVKIHISFFRPLNKFVGLEQFTNFETCGVCRGKALTEKEYLKLSEKEQSTCYEFKGLNNEVLYALPKETARTIVCRHLGGEVPLTDLYTEKVYTDEVLRELDENIIKPTFMLPTLSELEEMDVLGDDLDMNNYTGCDDITDDITNLLN